MLAETYRRYRLAKGDEKRKLARELVMKLSRYSHREPFWDEVRKLNLKPEKVKEVMLFLEENGEIEIRRSSDGKRLWILTLRDIRRNPVKLDRWLALKKPQRK
ncbi:hypothetical protein [Thermococcus henrietii]|uniref:hypothetical protein n=1 Tax=Thermococcus henrietii TaxID=2016361 RepID=UPI000C07A691|nr:hypothetical protein [Thermococcus henrietii]